MTLLMRMGCQEEVWMSMDDNEIEKLVYWVIVRNFHNVNLKARVGSVLNCPICNRQFVKMNNRHLFCATVNSGCEQEYLNLANELRRGGQDYDF